MQATSLLCLIAGCWSYILAVAGGMAICIDLMNQTHLNKQMHRVLANN